MTTEPALDLDNLFTNVQDPYPLYTYLREREPVRWNSMFNTFMFSKYEDVNLAFSDHQRFSSDVWTPVPDTLGEVLGLQPDDPPS